MSAVEPSPADSHLTVLPPHEAALRARPLPDDEAIALDDVTDSEWKAFDPALAER